jgi:hypothetical protein
VSLDATCVLVVLVAHWLSRRRLWAYPLLGDA